MALTKYVRPGIGAVPLVPGSAHLIGNTQPYAVTSAVFEALAQAGR